MTGRDAPPEAEGELVFLPLGGSGEIGMNLNLYGYRRGGREDWLMVDLGVTFGDPAYPGIDLVMPDISFIAGRRENLLGLVLTHAHEDHCGAVAYLWPELRCPVYATPFTAAIVRRKLAERDLLDEVPLHVVPLGGAVSLGPFEIQYISITHSIPEPNSLALRTPLGRVLHTGDWKLDPAPLIGELTNEAALRSFGDEGVLAMICDSTNVFSPGESGSEAAVRRSLVEIVRGLRGRVAVTTFASNVARIATIAAVAATHGRKASLVGRSIQENAAIARELGYFADVPPFISEEEAGYLPPDEVLYACTGSQGEPRGAMARIAAGDHPEVALEAGDTVIFSSKIIPGNEAALAHLHNALAVREIAVITERDHFVHVSGHPCRDELARMYQWIRPEIAIPVHGEARHIHEHAALARRFQVRQAIEARNGAMIRLAPRQAEVIDEAPSGRLLLDGAVLEPADGETIAVRRRLAHNGHVSVVLVVDRQGDPVAEPVVRLSGVPGGGDEDGLAEACVDAVLAVLARLSPGEARDDASMAEAARRAVRRVCRLETNKRPITEVEVVRIR